MEKTNVAVLGAGYWGKKIIGEYALLGKQNPSVNLLGVCDVLEENLKFCSEKFQIPFLVKVPEEILLNPEINAVHICTPSITHYNICKSALLNGKHVTVEKPMTLNPVEALELVELAREKNLILCVGHIFRFDAALEKARTLLQNGWFGDLYWLKLQWTAFMPPMTGRDVITDLAPHPFDILNYLTNDWPTKITCIAKAYRPGQKEETAHITSEFKNNLIAHIEVSWLHPEKIREVQIMGSKRFVKIDCLKQEIKAFDNGDVFEIPVERSNTIGLELEHFIRCIQESLASNDEYLNKNNGLVGANVVRLLKIARTAMKKETTQTVE